MYYQGKTEVITDLGYDSSNFVRSTSSASALLPGKTHSELVVTSLKDLVAVEEHFERSNVRYV